jgi:hypothetical protein
MLGGFEATGVVASSPFESPLIVEVEDDRPKDELRGDRCVSFNSASDLLAIALLQMIWISLQSREGLWAF